MSSVSSLIQRFDTAANLKAPEQNPPPRAAPKRTKTALEAINEDLLKYKTQQKLAAKKKKPNDGTSKFSFKKKNKQEDDMHQKIKDALATTDFSLASAQTVTASARSGKDEKSEQTSGEGGTITDTNKKQNLNALDTITEDMATSGKTNAKVASPTIPLPQDDNSTTPQNLTFVDATKVVVAENKIVDTIKEDAMSIREVKNANPKAASYKSFRKSYKQRKNRIPKNGIKNVTNVTGDMTKYRSSYQKWKESFPPRAFGSPYEVTFPKLISDSSDSSDEESNNMNNRSRVMSATVASETAGNATNNSETPFVAKISYYDSSDSEQSDSGVELPNKTVHFVAVITAHSESETDEESSVEETPFDRSTIPVRVNKANGLFIQSSSTRSSDVEEPMGRGTARRPFPSHKEWKLKKITNTMFGSKFARASSSDDNSKTSKSSGGLRFTGAALSIIDKNKSVKKLAQSDANGKPATLGKKPNSNQEIPSTLFSEEGIAVAGPGMQR